jgi:hypothetical protein
MTAHSRVLISTLCITALLGSGCIINNTPRGSPGDITFTWTFNGGRGCATVPDVTQVRITIPGQSLQNNGVYGCVNAGTAGIKLLAFRAGTYSYTVSGQNAQGQTLYTENGSVVVNGDVATSVDLRPTSDAKGQAYITWRFPQGATVDCATIAAVDVSINGALIQSAACATGLSGNGVFISGITAGNNVLTLAARDSNGFFYYRSDRTLVVTAGNDVVETTTLDYAVGSLPIKWTFNNGVTMVNCAQAGVTVVNVNLRDSTGTLLYGQTGTDVPCTNANGAQGTVFPYLYSGNYELFLQAYGTGGALYRTNFTTAPIVSVTAGTFPVIDNPTLTPAQLLTL